MTQNKRRKYCKFLSIIISFVMIFTVLPLIPVFADIEEGIESTFANPIETGDVEPLSAGNDMLFDADIEDGVYAIKNVGNSTSSYSLYMDTQYAHWLPGYHMQQYKFTGTATPCSDFAVSALFKITKVGDTYVIRILRNNLLSFQLTAKSSTEYEFLTTEIPINDDDVPYASRFSIQRTKMYSNEYVISQCNTSRYVSASATTASGSAGAPNSYLWGSSTITDYAKWTFVKYTGTTQQSVSLLGSGSLVAGEETELYPVFYSTRPGYNQLSLDIQSPSSESCLIDDSSPYGKIRITPYTDEDIVVDIKAGNGTDSYTIDTQTWSVGVPFEEGIYFFKNVRDTNKYVQINNIDNMDQDTIIELHNFHGYYEQRWNVEHVWNQYYKIISTHSDKALTAPTGANNDVVTQTDYTGELTQRWKFIEQSDGTYKISPASNSNYFMAAGDISSTADQDLEIRTAQSNGSDMWVLITEKDISLVALPEAYDRTSFFYDVIYDMSDIGYDDYYENSDTISRGATSGELVCRMATSKITVIRTHGNQTEITTSDGTLSRNDILDLHSHIFDASELIIYGACLTGKDREGASNLVNATHAQGNAIVIGFEKEVFSNEVNKWCSAFFEALSNGNSVEGACHAADEYIEDTWYDPNHPEYDIRTDSWYIAGSSSTTFT